MDSITHIVLGATIGEAIAGKSLGKKAMVIGAFAQSIPDIDFMLSIWLRPVDNLLAHRGLTHSIIFAVVLSILAGIIASRWSSGRLTRGQWIFFFMAELSVHLILDGFNNYGVGWFEPFTHDRISFNIIYVADPFYSIWLGIGFIVLIILPGDSPSRKRWTQATLIASSLYLAYALGNKWIIEKDVHKALLKQRITSSRILTTPLPLTTGFGSLQRKPNRDTTSGTDRFSTAMTQLILFSFPVSLTVKCIERQGRPSEIASFRPGILHHRNIRRCVCSSMTFALDKLPGGAILTQNLHFTMIFTTRMQTYLWYSREDFPAGTGRR
ncbi:MAG: metal-dependent hydrolase [Bacteroidota bacterium]